MFLLDDSHLTALFTAPFLVGLVLPGWRSLGVTGCAAIAIAVFAMATVGGHVASVLGFAFIITAIIGLCCGLLTRALTLWIAPFSEHPYRFAAVAVIGYFASLVVLSGPTATLAWVQRPSHGTCASSTYRMTAASQVLHVPAAPVFAVDVLPRRGSIDVGHLSFDSEHGLNELCGRALRDGEVIGPVVLNLYPWKFGGSHAERWAAATCGSTREKAYMLLCRLKDNDFPGRWQFERATIYGPEMTAAIMRDANYGAEKQLHQRLSAGLSPEALPPLRGTTDGFEIYPDGLRIARASDWAGESGEPFVLVCTGNEESPSDNALFCAAAGTVAGGLRVKFLFRSKGERLTADARKIRLFLQELAASLRAGTA